MALEPPPAGPGEPTTPRLGYQPALDGLRGAALLAIVAFHAQVDGVGGAFLSVSTFFTLSGFLITAGMLAERDRTGTVGIRAFYARRARRLLPAALVAVVAITAATVLAGDATQVARLRGDALASLGYVANWRLVLAGDSYGAIFDSPSTFTHFWTLGIEEQFYLAFPLLVVGVLAATRGSTRALALAVGTLALASTAWVAHLHDGGAGLDRVYFGTDTRLAEILVGCLAAMAWHRRPVLRPVTQRILAGVGLAGLALMLGLWHVADRADESFYRGGLLAYAALTALVVVAAVQPVGPLRRVLALRPLVFVGTVSYGAYLFHWPILVWLQQHTGHPPWTRTAIGLALSIGLATASLQLLERPVRTGRWPATARAAPVGLGACALAVGAVVGLTPWRADTTTTTDFEAAANLLDELGEPPPVPDEAAAELSPDDWEALERWAARDRAIAESDAPRLAVFGDSTAVMTGYGLSHWMFDNLDTLAPAPGSATLGCGLLDDVVRRVGSAEAAPPPACDGWTGRWRAATEATTIDVALVQFGPWDVRPHQLEPGGPFLVVGEDPELDAALGRRLAEGVDVLLEEVPVVVLVASPDVTFGRVAGRDPGRASPDADPARMARFRALLDEVAASRDRVAVVDLHGHLAGRDDDRRLRPDGVHFTEATAEEVAGWLGPELARLHDRLRPDAPT